MSILAAIHAIYGLILRAALASAIGTTTYLLISFFSVKAYAIPITPTTSQATTVICYYSCPPIASVVNFNIVVVTAIFIITFRPLVLTITPIAVVIYRAIPIMFAFAFRGLIIIIATFVLVLVAIAGAISTGITARLTAINCKTTASTTITVSPILAFLIFIWTYRAIYIPKNKKDTSQ